MTTPNFTLLGWVTQCGTMWKAQQSVDYGNQSQIFSSVVDAKGFLQSCTPKKANWSQVNPPDQPEQWEGRVYQHTAPE